VTDSLYIVNENLASVGSPTVMVGTCTDANLDGYTVASECPADSYYRHLLAADAGGYYGVDQHQYEISEVFHRHVTDANRVAAGTQLFPYADQLPNSYIAPPMIQVEAASTTLVTTGAENDSGSIRFDAAERITIQCCSMDGPGSHTRSKLKILQQAWTRS
jgi:hypothetical protein